MIYNNVFYVKNNACIIQGCEKDLDGINANIGVCLNDTTYYLRGRLTKSAFEFQEWGTGHHQRNKKTALDFVTENFAEFWKVAQKLEGEP